MFPFKTRPLGRSYLVAALIAVAFLTGLSTGFGLFYRVVYILGLTAVLSFLWTWLSVQSLEVTVQRRTPRARVGDNIEERIVVRNLSKLPKPVLEVEDLTDLPGYSSGMAFSLSSKGMRSWTTTTPARKRGVYTMGPVQVANTDAFGLFRRERRFSGTDKLIVYPRIHQVPGFELPPAHLSGDNSTRKRSHDLTPHAASVREYAFGDSISRVHWNSTARMGKLMSKEFDLERSSDVWVFIDLHRDVQAGEMEDSTDEYGVSIAASLAKRYLDANLPTGLLAYGDQRYFLPPETGPGQFSRMLEFLAMSKADGTVHLENALTREQDHLGYNTSLVVITSSHRLDWIGALRELAKRRVRIAVVLLDGQSFGGFFNTLEVGPELNIADISPYIVRKGDDISAALSQRHATLTMEAVEKLEATEALL